MAVANKKKIHSHNGKLTPKSETSPEKVQVDDSARLKEIRKLVEENNQSSMPTDVIICHIYMESRFDSNPHAAGSSAKGLMQLLKAPIREMYRLENMKKPKSERLPDAQVFQKADAFHNGPSLIDEAINIQTGTKYLQLLIDNEKRKGAADPIAEAYKDYRGVRNGIYYKKIKSMADNLKGNPDSMQVLRDGVK
ncbi:transglycosylase [Chromobacterium sp. ATCC 53434]|uniref:lytic transglycosylase domain-containing protein n=1 Tax=Chromobacterium sp. (strain ATCC 53434 / SC 14030) TaxID=2059672 RepID=UPI000C774EF6|nr:lytic transglycosylase domain-containing protein [Chromobacterium sp. ATCC 53434]AUH53427.1 transglycosylase [Chromobacterium sp. ATCC 53434]